MHPTQVITSSPPRANRRRLQADFEALAAVGRQPSGGLLRAAYTPAYLEGRDLVRGWLAEAGLTTRVDVIGNLFGRTPGPDGPVVRTGSHLDAVRNGGTFDGAVGVVGAVEAVRAIVEAGVMLRRPIEVVGFVDEEGRFAGLLGSAVMTGAVAPERLAGLRDEDGVAFEAALAEAGLDPARVGAVARSPDELAAFVELHIEQGAVLERAGVPIGVVTATAGTHRLAVEIVGRADHAGATPMDARQDALQAAAEIVVAVRRIALESGRPTLRATVGQLSVEPNVTSAVAERVRLVVDVRDVEADVRAVAARRVEEAIAAACAREALAYRIENPMSAPPGPTDPAIRAAIAAACARVGAPWMPIVSGASHDAQNLARVIPTGMIFVPSHDGRSHCPAERTEPEQLALGTDVLIATLLELAT
jgi:hydantoinase/carbamoylase family amidase